MNECSIGTNYLKMYDTCYETIIRFLIIILSFMPRLINACNVVLRHVIIIIKDKLEFCLYLNLVFCFSTLKTLLYHKFKQFVFIHKHNLTIPLWP